MGAYSYKTVMYRDDFLAAVKPAMEEINYDESDYDGDPGYDGDGWIVADYLLRQKDKRIAELEAQLAKALEENQSLTRYSDNVDNLMERRDLKIARLWETLRIMQKDSWNLTQKVIPNLREQLTEAREFIREAYEVYAGSESFEPETAPEAYQARLLEQMAGILGKALAGEGVSDGPRR